MSNLPDSILADLANPDPAARLAAVSALAALGEQATSQPALTALARLAANDPDPSVRSAAFAVLRSQEARAVFSNQTLPRETRQAMFQQIDRWQIDGLLTREQAEVLRLRYNFERQPIPLADAVRAQLRMLLQRWTEQSLISPVQASSLAESLSPPAAAPVEPVKERAVGRAAGPVEATVRPAAGPVEVSKKPAERASTPAPSLSQILFSETSIRIALFLGGFLVVAAALILAALVEVARLPVLLGMAVISGAGALISRRRLPLPSYVLYIIFASSLPILARVLVDMLHLSGADSDAYWSAAWLLLALALAVGTRLYTSRLMSFAALGGLVATAFELSALLSALLNLEWQAMGLMLALAAIAGLLGAAALQRWKDFSFALPLYLGAHLVALAALLLTPVQIITELVFLETPGVTLVSVTNFNFFALAWLALAAFYIIADRYVRPFALLPYLAAGPVLLFPWTLAQAFYPDPMSTAGILAAWGAVCALGGAALDQSAQIGGFRRYGRPLMFGAPVLFAWAALIGLDEDITMGLVLLLAAAAVLTVLNVLRRRVWAWSAALLFALAAYFAFFQLPMFENVDLNEALLIVTPGLLLLLPEFFNFSKETNGRWRLAPRWLGLIVLSLIGLTSLLLTFTGDEVVQRDSVVIYSITAVFFLALALRRRMPYLALVTTALLPAALVQHLLTLDTARWLPWLAGVAVVYYAVGLALQRSQAAWSVVFRYSALAVGFLLIFRLPYEHDWIGGLSVLAAGLLFLFELLRGPRARLTSLLEVPLDTVLIASLFGLLNPLYQQSEAQAWALGLLLAALIVLGLDLYLSRANAGQQVSAAELPRWVARFAGVVLASASLLYNIGSTDLPAGWAAAIFAVSAAYALAAALVYPLPRLGYVLIGYLALALLYLLRAFNLDIWLAPEIALAGLLYAGSFALAANRADNSSAGAVIQSSAWAEVLRYGGLALALFASLTAPWENTGLWASLWVACAATLYAVEAFRRRSVWWGFPTDGLYLLAYFLLLIDLHVDQPQYFSVAIALLGMLQHYLLIRTGSSLGAFITGMVSQLVLLGTTYWQMVSTEQLGYFVILFFQGLAVLVYGIILRSRSLVITPLIFIVLGVMTVVLSILSGVPTAIIIGCTGILLLTLGILAVIMRERLVQASEKMGGWRA